MMKLYLALLALFAFLPTKTFATDSIPADLTVASPFTDNAVLQRDKLVPIWGTATPATTVTATFGEQTKSSVADNDGKWMVQLDPMPANFKPQILEVSDGTNNNSFSNILVGEVWICSGQSNMQQGVRADPNLPPLVAKAKNLRTFAVKRMVALTQQDSLQGKWVEGHPNSAVAFSFAYFLEQSGDVPVGIILSCWGSSSLEAWMPRDMVDTVPHFKTMMEEFDADTQRQETIKSILAAQPWNNKNDIYLRRQTNILYNAMIHPLIPYACRGLVWYQGERNTQSMFGMSKKPWYYRHSGMLKYGDTLKAWIQRYRKAWQSDDMQFMIVMLPGFYKPIKTGPKTGAEHPSAHSWAWMRESQLKALDLPHTSVVNTIDLGDKKNIHPKDKLPIGKRLALLAARNSLDQDVQANGPMMKAVEVKGDQLIVHFDHADGLKTIDGKPPTAFWLADDSETWAPAKAEIKGQTVTLRSDQIETPLYVRYAFAGKPRVNLVNSADLPAYPFRSDQFDP